MKIPPPNQLLRRFLRSSRDRLSPVIEHLETCPNRSNMLQALRNRRSAGSAYDAALISGADFFQELQAAYERERVDAKGLVSELLKHPGERQRILIHNHPRFHTWGVFELLLETSRKESAENPSLAEELSRLALDLSQHLDSARYGSEAIEDLRGRAWAYIGNARRVQSDLRGAQDALERALSHLRQGTRDPWERAVWLDLKASLFRAQRRFEDAKRLLNRALALFLSVGDQHRAGRTLVNLDTVLHQAGQAEKGIPLLYRALDLIDPEQEPRLLLITKHNLIDDLAEAGRYLEAQRLLLRTHPLYQRFDEPWLRCRRSWVEGKIARGLSQPDRAEELFGRTRTGFVELGAFYDVALVSLDLASLFTEQGRTTELKRLAGEMVPIFSSLQIHRETLAAFTLWKQAVEAETAGIELAARLASSLKRARYEQPPSGREII